MLFVYRNPRFRAFGGFMNFDHFNLLFHPLQRSFLTARLQTSTAIEWKPYSSCSFLACAGCAGRHLSL
jgi:hypothetical protein